MISVAVLAIMYPFAKRFLLPKLRSLAIYQKTKKFILHRGYSIKLKVVKEYKTRHEPLVDKYLTNKNGIEIGGSITNDYRLYETGAYCNVNWAIDAWNKFHGAKTYVNIVALGDDLPFKDNVFDYVFTSHVMEHFFDPIKAIKEHLRVVKKGGILLYIIPNVDKIYDKGRSITDANELVARYNGKLKIISIKLLFFNYNKY